ncbi:MAG: transposase [Planctomycetaceae bacterium]|jgi:hypothetical protein|nr:transposase [Planctomycetaceae bacterium]
MMFLPFFACLHAELPSNSGRQRVNINGAVNIDTLEIEVDFTDSVNAESMKRLMDQLIKSNPNAKIIYRIMDNASYCHSKEMDAYCQQLDKIKFLFLPTHFPINSLKVVGGRSIAHFNKR